MKNKDKALQLTRKMPVVILMTMLCGCLSETHHLGFVSVGQEGWTSTDTISYVVPPLGTCEKHGVALMLLTEGYEYANIALDVTIKQDSVSLYHEQSNFDLTACDSKQGIGNRCDYLLPLGNLAFCDTLPATIVLTHQLDRSPLKGITKVGVHIGKPIRKPGEPNWWVEWE